MIVYKTGDLFTSEADAFAHGCNTLGKMGAGIAKEFKARYFDMFKEYRKLCGDGSFNVGEGYIYKTTDNKYIFNLATQGSFAGATTDNISACFIWMKNKLESLNVTRLAMPRIGCGLGGLNWDNQVLPLLEDILGEEELIIEVWIR